MKLAGKEMREKERPLVMLPGRPEVRVDCPCCWTAQRSARESCYRCGARFVYADEGGLPQRAGPTHTGPAVAGRAR